MNKTALTLAVAAALTLAGCSSTNTSTETAAKPVAHAAQNQAFSTFSEKFIEDLWRQYPEFSQYAGYGKYDDIITIPNAATRASNIQFSKDKLAKLYSFNVDSLSGNQKTDYYLIENSLKKTIWNTEKFKGWQWNPSTYNVSYGFANILNSRFKSESEKFKTVLERLKYVPEYYAAAQQNIDTPTIEYTQLAIAQNEGAFAVLKDDLLDEVDASEVLTAQEKALFKTRFANAKTAINGYIAFLTQLEKDLTENGNARSFRIGEELYEEKFAFDIQSGYTAKKMYEKALADKARVTNEMVKLTDQLWPKYFPDTQRPANDTQAISELIKHLSQKHVAKEDFVTEIKRQIPLLEQFVIEKDLITLDPEKPLVVRETPEYMRGFAMASISSPGPYDSKENTYYNVEPLELRTEEQANSILREYNHWILQILNIHEAVPGHYTQLVYANKSPSLVKSILRNGAMIEGWAVYTERMMLEEGYGDHEPEMWLMYYKWNLRVICNTILDYGIQVKGISRDEGLDLLMNGAFQERAEAEGKWRRATLSQVQLTSYYSGYREIYDLREKQKEKLGKDFDLKAFHEEFLSFGSAPVKYINQLMND
ncbi:DUF885 domain-containing protein [Pseudoalteromonas luteoviolacea]|uniref:Lipoprotein n=1 Tax=Pseudoalteromonas luteoviolacea DSM 6061 TaxID=1365250 RepID=A0A161ZTJ0_9GAMM|nr:DUF885 domain-containing protein [Pseudoalteromonas luteoviolacea]KZN31820.1 hypothetical protein N475_22810 [Pseudoalteromonas luteoviolacea DSM 6061]MBE0389749.1 hypothetical protein [Pseudoalteromonas luteoviolacea DSM 6061]